jgi:hypothetical protein
MKGYQFLVTLEHVQPPVWRQIALPSDLDFYDLHSVIQTAMGWSDSHLFSFVLEEAESTNIIRLLGDEESVEENFQQAKHFMQSPPEKGSFEERMFQNFIRTKVLLARDIHLDTYVEEVESFTYTYDFGDGWTHQVKLEEVLDEFELDAPTILAGEGNCPPEDVGGPPGYEEFLRVMKNKKHPEHAQMKSWADEQGYKEFDIEDANEILQDEWC